MRNVYLTLATSLWLLAACDSIKKQDSANFTKSINQCLVRHGKTCTAIVRQFPIDIPTTEQKEQYGIGPKLMALEHAGLVHSSDMTAVVHGLLDPLRGPTPPQRVKRYELTTEGKKYFSELPGPMGQMGSFCYGQKVVDSIVKWTEPVSAGAASQAEVTYTYKIADLAGWVEDSEVQQAFPDIRVTLSGVSKTPEIAGLQLTNKGWEVPGQ